MGVCRNLEYQYWVPKFLTNFKIVTKKEKVVCELVLECLKLLYMQSALPASKCSAIYPSGSGLPFLLHGTLAIH